MKYLIDLDDTLIYSTDLNNDAYNYALRKYHLKTLEKNGRITREDIKPTLIKSRIILTKQSYFCERWMPYRVIYNTVLINKISIQNSNPSHSDIISALKYCKQNDISKYQSIIIPLINDIYNCKNVKLAKLNLTFLDYNGDQHPIAVILLALKWLFIEQDLTYWNNSGRAKLYNELKDNDLL